MPNLDSIRPHQRANKRVTWRDGYKPVAHPHTCGTVFLSRGAQTAVIWDNEKRPQFIATVALRTLP